MLESKPTIQQISNDAIQLHKQIHTSEHATIFHGTWYGQDIAVKRFDKTKQRGNFEQNFQKTIEMMGKYRFPTIINYYGVFLNANDYAMVMEWMPKGSLNDVLHNPSETFAWNPVRWQIAIDTAAGLSYLHGQGAVHGDLSSFSIMLDMDYRAKLTLNSKEGLGAVRWRAPELFKRGATTNPASEVYSFGMVLWEITSRKKPYENDEDDATVGSYIKDNDKETIPETTPKAFADSINACWNEMDKRPVASQILKWLSEAKPPVEMPSTKMIEPEVESKSVPTSVPAVLATEKTQNNVSANPIISKTIVPVLNPLQASYIEKLLPILLKAFTSKETAIQNAAKNELIHIKNLIPEPLIFDVIDTLLNAMADENNDIVETAAQVLGEFADNIPKIIQTKVLRVMTNTMTTKHQTNSGYSNSQSGTNDRILKNLALTFVKLNGIISDDFRPLVATTILTCMRKEAAGLLKKIWPNHSGLIDVLLQLIANKDTNSLLAMNILVEFKDYAQFFVAKLNVYNARIPGFYLYRKVDSSTNTEEMFAHVVYKSGRSNWREINTVVTNSRRQKIYSLSHDFFIHTETLNLSQLAAEKGSLALLEGLHPVQESSETYFNEGLMELIKSNCDPEQLQDRSSLRKKSPDIIPVLLAALTQAPEVRLKVAKTLCDLKEIIPANQSVEIIQLLVNEQNFFVDEAVILQQYFRNLPEVRTMALEDSIVQQAHSAIDAFKLEGTEKINHESFNEYTKTLIRFKTWISETQHKQIIDALVTILKKNNLFDENIFEAIIQLKECISASYTPMLFNTLFDIIKSRHNPPTPSICEYFGKFKLLIPDAMKHSIIEFLLSAMNIEMEYQDKDTQPAAIESLGILIDFMTIEQRMLLVDELLNKMEAFVENGHSFETSLAVSIYKTLGQCYGFISDELNLKIVKELMKRIDIYPDSHDFDSHYINNLSSDCYALDILVKLKMIMPDNLKENLFYELSNNGASEKYFNAERRAHYLEAMIELSTVLSQDQKLATATALMNALNYLNREEHFWEVYSTLNLLVKLKDQSGNDVEIKVKWELLDRMLRNIMNCKKGLTKETFRPGVNYVITSLIAEMQQEPNEHLDEIGYFFEEVSNLLSDTHQVTLIALLIDKIKTTYDIRFVEMLLTLKKSFSEKDKDTLWEYLITLLKDKLHTTGDKLLTVLANTKDVFSEAKRHAMLQFLFSQMKSHFEVQLAKCLMTWKDFLSDMEKRQLANILIENFQTDVAANLQMVQELGSLSADIIPIVLKPILRALENPAHPVRLAAIKVLVAFNMRVPTELHRQIIESLLIALMDESNDVRGGAASALAQFKDVVPADMYAQLQQTLLKCIEHQYHPEIANTLVQFKASIEDILIPQIIIALINMIIIKEERINTFNRRKEIVDTCNEHAVMMLLAFKEYVTGEMMPRILSVIGEVLSKLKEDSQLTVLTALLELNKQLNTQEFNTLLLSVIEKNWHALHQKTNPEIIKILTALNLSSPGLIKDFRTKEALAHFGINDLSILESLHRGMMSSDQRYADEKVYQLGYATIPLSEVMISDLFKTLGKYPSASFALGRASQYQPDIIDKLFEKLNEKDLKPDVMAIILQALSIGLQAMVTVVQDKQNSQAHGNNRNLFLAQPTSNLNPGNPSLSSTLGMRMG